MTRRRWAALAATPAVAVLVAGLVAIVAAAVTEWQARRAVRVVEEVMGG